MLLAAKTGKRDWCVSIRLFVSQMSVGLLLVKLVGLSIVCLVVCLVVVVNTILLTIDQRTFDLQKTDRNSPITFYSLSRQ